MQIEPKNLINFSENYNCVLISCTCCYISSTISHTPEILLISSQYFYTCQLEQTITRRESRKPVSKLKLQNTLSKVIAKLRPMFFLKLLIVVTVLYCFQNYRNFKALFYIKSITALHFNFDVFGFSNHLHLRLN